MIDISIVTPTYNRAALLPRAWQSIRSQEVRFQWVVADDGSIDDTAAVVAQFSDARISYLRLPTNRGVNAARNAGALVAVGRYVVLLDSDDELYPGALSRMVEVMESVDLGIGVCAFACIRADTGDRISRLPYRAVLDERHIVCCGGLQQGGDSILVYRREVFDEYRLPEDLRGCEQVFVYQVSKRFRYLTIDEPGSIVHQQGDNLSGAESLIRRSRDIAVSYERIIENHAPLIRGEAIVLNRFLRKAMYRYGVAGLRRDVWRLYRRLLAEGPGFMQRLLSCGCMLVSMTAPRPIERWRINRMQRRHREWQVR